MEAALFCLPFSYPTCKKSASSATLRRSLSGEGSLYLKCFRMAGGKNTSSRRKSCSLFWMAKMVTVFLLRKIIQCNGHS